MKRIGVLALQGDFAEHVAMLQHLDAEPRLVRLRGELDSLDGLIIPGGESTTISRLMREYELLQPISDFCQRGLPVMGTCAGMVLLASNVVEPVDSRVTPLNAMDIDVKRNAFGRQVDSFEADIEVPAIGERAFRGVFIRAPFIQRAGDGVAVLARLPDGTCVAARQGNMLALSFHPELTDDSRLHSYFLSFLNGDVKP